MPGVDRVVVQTDLVVEVRAGRAAGGADEAEELAAGYVVAHLDVDVREVAVAAGKAVTVVDLDHVAVAALPAGFDDLTGGRGQDLFAAFAVDVHSGVELVCSAAERVTAKSEFVVDLAEVCPHVGDKGRI